MTARSIWARRAGASLVAILTTVGMSGCASPLGFPLSGAVQTMAPAEQQQRRVYTEPIGPRHDAQPESIVRGFLSALPAGVQADGFAVAKEYLTKAAAKDWNGDAGTIVYGGEPDYVRKANASGSDGLTVEVRVQIVGRLDKHGIYTPMAGETTTTLRYSLVREKSQWRIVRLDDGIVISSADFDQVFRQIALWRFDASNGRTVPDVRWFSWRNWRTQAVRELLEAAPDWLAGALRDVNAGKVRLAAQSVPVNDGTTEVRLSSDFARIDESDRALLVAAIKATLSDGGEGLNIRITANGVDYSDADGDAAINPVEPEAGIYTLTGGRIVSLMTSAPVRVAQTQGFEDAKGLVFSETGGAVLRADGLAECLDAQGGSCGVMFSGTKVSSITAGSDGEIWGVAADGRSLVVDKGGKSDDIALPWLADGQRVNAIALSAEGTRLALAVTDGESEQGFSGVPGGVAMTGVMRDAASGMPSGVASARIMVSVQPNVGMLTFYNDQMLIYAATPDGLYGSGGQHAWRQLAPGPAETQRLPEDSVLSLSTGRIARTLRLAALDDHGVVRSVSGSLDGSWSISDSQVTALGAQ